MRTMVGMHRRHEATFAGGNHKSFWPGSKQLVWGSAVVMSCFVAARRQKVKLPATIVSGM